MFTTFALYLFYLATFDVVVDGCLITNCPRGGKRGENFPLVEPNNIRTCTPCGPLYAGQCYGPNICCGPFGCYMGTKETLRCRGVQEAGVFRDKEPCLLNGIPCRKNTGKCAADSICCTHDACFLEKECEIEENRPMPDNFPGLGLYNLMNKYRSELANEK